MRRASQLASML